MMLTNGILIGHVFFPWDSVIDIPNGVSVSWLESVSSGLFIFSAVTWFIGGIVGYLIAPIAFKSTHKQIIYVSLTFQKNGQKINP